jgi:hypothetical protein
MSDEKLKLGWTMYETIGVAVVNPRAVNGIISREIFGNARGSIELRRHSIEIQGAVEIAARAFAEDILSSRKSPEPLDTSSWRYLSLIEVTHDEGIYVINLTENGQGLIDPNLWIVFKTMVEKICNNLTVFI